MRPGRVVGPAGTAVDDAGGAALLVKIIACENRLEQALHLLVEALGGRPKHGKKPIALHGLRVATTLGAMGYEEDVVVAGLLHDILERTAVPAARIKRRFGARVGAMVQAATSDARIEDPLQRYCDSLERCAAAGKGALLVRGADLIDNCDRLLALGALGRLGRVAAKLRMLIDVSRNAGVDGRMIAELVRRHRRLARKIGGLAPSGKHAFATAKAARLAR